MHSQMSLFADVEIPQPKPTLTREEIQARRAKRKQALDARLDAARVERRREEMNEAEVTRLYNASLAEDARKQARAERALRN